MHATISGRMISWVEIPKATRMSLARYPHKDFFTSLVYPGKNQDLVYTCDNIKSKIAISVIWVLPQKPAIELKSDKIAVNLNCCLAR